MLAIIGVIAYVALFILLILNSLATNWFVFGLWPHSWLLYALFSFTSLLILLMMSFITSGGSEKRRGW